MNLMEEKVGSSLERIGTGDYFLKNIRPETQTPRSTISKWDLMKLRSFYKSKILSIGQNDSPQDMKRCSPTLPPAEG